MTWLPNAGPIVVDELKFSSLFLLHFQENAACAGLRAGLRACWRVVWRVALFRFPALC